MLISGLRTTLHLKTGFNDLVTADRCFFNGGERLFPLSFASDFTAYVLLYFGAIPVNAKRP